MQQEPLGPPPPGLTWHERAASALGARDLLPTDADLFEDERAGGAVGGGPRGGRWPGLAAVAAGGCLGAIARYGLERAVRRAPAGFPLTTWVINTSGAFALGVILTVLVERRPGGEKTALMRAFACTGVLGAWTTVSTFAGEADGLARAGRPGLAAGYLAATLAGGVIATTAGIALSRRRMG